MDLCLKGGRETDWGPAVERLLCRRPPRPPSSPGHVPVLPGDRVRTDCSPCVNSFVSDPHALTDVSQHCYAFVDVKHPFFHEFERFHVWRANFQTIADSEQVKTNVSYCVVADGFRCVFHGLFFTFSWGAVFLRPSFA